MINQTISREEFKKTKERPLFIACRNHKSIALQRLQTASLLLLLGILCPSKTLTAQTAPTAKTLTPQQIDAQWIASTAAYAPQRARVLESVDKTIAAGPFRSDWASLSH